MTRRSGVKLLLALLLSSAGVLLSGAQIVNNGRRYVSDDEFARRYGMRSRLLPDRVEIYDSARKVTVYQNKRYCIFNGIKYSLSFAPIKQGRVYVSQLDQLSLFDSLLGKHSVPWHKINVIVIDPGHGGKDQGASGVLYKEKNITLQISKRIRDLLQRAGYRVLMTRSGDSNMGLQERPDFANRAKADLFISVHVNASATKTVSGIETFTLTPHNAPSDGSSQVGTTLYIGNTYTTNSVALANHIHRQLISRSGAVDRGLKRARFMVLRSPRCPAVLLELGFVSNPAEERKLGADAHQVKLAQAVAVGVMTYHKELIRNRQTGKIK